MLADYFGNYIRPDELAAHKDWFTPSGLVIWNKLKFNRMKFVWRAYARDDARIKAALKDPKQAVIFEVADKSHWVVGVRPTLWGNSYIVVDPWSGKKVDVIKTYRNITGAAYFKS